MDKLDYFDEGYYVVSDYLRRLEERGEPTSKRIGEFDVSYSNFSIAKGFWEWLEAPSLDKRGLLLTERQIKRVGKTYHKEGEFAANELVKKYINSAEGAIHYKNMRARTIPWESVWMWHEM